MTRLITICFTAILMMLYHGALKAQAITENFDDITTLSGDGWVINNASVPVGPKSWYQGVPASGGNFDSYNGATDSYILVNYNSTTGANAINNWLLTPNRTFKNGDVITFYSRKATADTYVDHLEVRLSTNGASTNVGDLSSQGDFTTLLYSINPTFILGVYPTTWTLYTITISGLPAPTSGRIGFRYYLPNGGPSGTQSDVIGIDAFQYTPYVCPTITLDPTSGALDGGHAGLYYSNNFSQTGALGAPNFAITAGALPPGLTLSASGAISGTPTATGTFNFTTTVNDNSSCSTSNAYSLTMTCGNNPTTFNGFSMCDNDGIIELQGSPAGGTYYANDGITGSQFDPAVGTQDVTYAYTDPYGCYYETTATVVVNTAPTVSLAAFDPACKSSTAIALSGGSPAGGVYSGTNVAGGQFTPSSAGITTITYSYTDANSCTSSADADINVTVCNGVTDALVIPGLKYFPNPSNGRLSVEFDENFAANVQIEITDARGNKIITDNQPSYSRTFDLSGFPKGMYTLELRSENKTSHYKIVLQ